MQPYEIFNATYNWKNCTDMRPWLIVELRANGIIGCFPISGECYDGNCFWIDPTHPDFSATGLAKGSCVHDQYIVELSVNQFQSRRGELVGKLLDEFPDYAGL
jgi:hypothetical protein